MDITILNYSKVFAFLSFFACLTLACLFSRTETPKNPPRDHWDLERHPRKYSPDFNCECGEDSDYLRKPWNFNVHVTTPTWTRICTGTLITSNFVVTSHACLLRSSGRDSKMSPFEAWDPAPRNIIQSDARVTPENIQLTAYPKQPENNMILTVSKIIYNPRFAINSATENFPGDDLAILVLTEHITQQEMSVSYRPICLPEFDPNLDVTRQLGLYYGIGAHHSNDPTTDFRTASDLVILEGPECDEEAGFDQFSSGTGKESLCVRFSLPAPATEGGPLMLRTMMDSKSRLERGGTVSTAFLVGISSVAVKRRKGSRLNYVYFTNIIPLIKYIELQASRHGSLWCRTPPVKLKLKAKVDKDNALQPWEQESEDSYKREETLDCVCGVKNSDGHSRSSQAESRIAGGEDAVAYEFGWQARMTAYFGNGKSSICGGSIINNLFILTAGHCVVRTDLLIQHGIDASDKALAQRIQVYIRTHTRNKDPHEESIKVKKIFVHPEYIQAEWEYRDRNANKTNYNFYLGSDIAILLLDHPITFAKTAAGSNMAIRPVCLPKTGNFVEFVGKNAIVSGWGVTNPEARPEQQTSSEVLLKLEKPVLPLVKCSSHSEIVITDDVICAGYLNRSKDTGSGDSGGPLIIKQEGTDQWIQVGVVSYGVDYFDKRKYKLTTALYTNVQKYLQFLDYYSKFHGAKWCQYSV